MPSQCYWCIEGKPAYGNQLGTMGEPFAVCHRCNILCCGHHGQRDHGAQKFFCFDCDKTILIVSALAMGNLSPETINGLSQRTVIIKVIDLTRDYLFSSFDDFLRRRPGYGYYFKDINMEESVIDYNNWNDEFLRQVFQSLPPEAQKLLVAAAIIISDTTTEGELLRIGDPLLLNLKTSVRVLAYA